MEQCPCCNSHAIEKTGETKEKDELDYKIVVVKRRHKFVEYECKECGKKFHEEIPNNLKEENQYGAQVQALELTLMNQANVTINKAQKITKTAKTIGKTGIKGSIFFGKKNFIVGGLLLIGTAANAASAVPSPARPLPAP